MSFIIREMIVSDAMDVARLSGQLGYTMAESSTLHAIQEILKNKNEMLFVATANSGKVVGWIHVFRTIRIESGYFCEIGGLVVDEAHQKKGIGKLLVDEVIAWCREKNNDILRVRSNIKRTDAHAFYDKLGFTENKQQKVFQLKLV